jgi:hypothetical protein
MNHSPIHRALFSGAAAFALLTGLSAEASTFEFLSPGWFQTQSVTQAGNYEIRIGGANGGNSDTLAGGIGALISGTFYLAAGTQFNVLVGGDGGGGNYTGGGGGMSYFRSATLTAVAGGGGGGGWLANFPGGDGLATATAGGFGGGGYGGGGGAGINGDGQENGSVSDGWGSGGKSTSGGFSGGAGGNGTAGFGGDGGYGGGGGGGAYGGGGGGGYSGGNGGGYSGGGGGGSYVTAAHAGAFNVLFGGARGASTYSGGYLTMDLIAPSTVPLPGAGGLLALALAGLVARGRRRTNG